MIRHQVVLALLAQNQSRDLTRFQTISKFEPKHPSCWILFVVELELVDVGEAVAVLAISVEHYRGKCFKTILLSWRNFT